MANGFEAKVLQVMIASPGDVKDKREIIRNVIYDFNSLHAEREKIVLLPVGWETHAYPQMGDHPQTILNEQLLKQCDLLVGVFGTKLGSPTENFSSGTLEEIQTHISNGKPAMIYFSEEDMTRHTDLKQLQRLNEFQEEFLANKSDIQGYAEFFSSSEDFQDKFSTQLHRMVVQSKFFSEEEPINANPVEKGSKQSTQPNMEKHFDGTILSEEAKILLVEASQSESDILMFTVKEGTIIQVNDKQFTPKNPREDAYYQDAVEELEKAKYIKAQGSKRQIFKLTKDGYQYGDALSSQKPK